MLRFNCAAIEHCYLNAELDSHTHPFNVPLILAPLQTISSLRLPLTSISCRCSGWLLSSLKVDRTSFKLAFLTLIADVDLTLEASCEGALLETSRDYCVILGSREDRDPVRSKYASRGRGGSKGQWRWTRPFGHKMQVLVVPQTVSSSVIKHLRFRQTLPHAPTSADSDSTQTWAVPSWS